MRRLLGLIYVIFLSYSHQALSANLCGFSAPDSSAYIFDRTNCSISVKGKKNYMHLDTFQVKTDQPFEALKSDSRYFISEDGKTYFAQEVVEGDANYTIQPKHQQPAIEMSIGDMNGLLGYSEIFVQSMPKKQDGISKSDFFSLTLDCLNIAAGGQKNSFITMYCVPKSKSGKKNLQNYKNYILKFRETP
jgi:hypothetical protein